MVAPIYFIQFWAALRHSYIKYEGLEIEERMIY